MSRLVVVFLLALGIGAVVAGTYGCRRGGRVDPGDYPIPRPAYPTGAVTIVKDGRRFPLEVEVAATNGNRAYGMMFVSEPLADDRGMIFIYPEPRSLSFWMRNTLQPLDLVYIDDDGRIINAHREMVPLDDNRSYPALRSCRFALELRGGWLEDHGVWIGDRVELSDEILAVEAEPMDASRTDIPRFIEAR